MQRQETYDYNHRLQPVRIQLGTSSNNAANYCLVYNYYAGVANPTSCTATPSQGTTGNNGNVMGYRYEDAANPTLQHSAQYTFDGGNRLATATGTPFGSGNVSYYFPFIYDQYGNMTCNVTGNPNGPCPTVTYYPSSNRIYQIGGLPAGYDAAGNMTSDGTGPGTHTYQWDAEGRMTSVDSGSTATYKYNSLGQRVERFLTNGSWTFDYLFGVGGEELGLYNAGGATWFDQDVPMGRRILVMYGSPLRIVHANNLGTTTVVTDQTGTQLEDHLFYPWGQSWTGTGLGYDMRFAGMHQFESPELLYPTDFRKYNPALGRWMSPDPLGGDLTNPQSLNRYAYVLNNPTTLTDPLGLNPYDGNPGDPCNDPAYADGHAECSGPGGHHYCDYYDPGCDTGYGGRGRGGRGGGGGGGATASGSPPAGQPPLAGMGNGAFPIGSKVCSIVLIPGAGPRLSCTWTLFPSPWTIAGIGATVGSFAAYLLHKPWQMSWIVPLAPEPGVLGVGPAGDFAWNPATRTFCMGLGAGIAEGHNAAIGPLLFAKTFNGVPAFPSGVNGILSGSSASGGFNLSNGFGGQVTANGAGIAAGPTLGAPGASAAYTYSGCWSF